MIEPREQINRYLPLTPERAERFVEEWEGFVLSCIQRMRITDTEDVLYRVFYRALNALPDFRGESRISTWLYRISWREGLRHIRKQERTADREAAMDREILALRYLEELKTTELAQRLEIPTGTVKARIHRALARLKVLLEKDHDK
jgi:DNA-directed RNA polymerase specialized sigma24 family protein